MKYTFEGTASWAKVFEHNRDMQGFKGANIQCDGKYTIDLEVNDETKDRIKSTGTMKQGRRENPNIFRFDRKHKHSVEAFGGAPEVFNEAGAPWDIEVDGAFIGNGSEVKLVVDITKDKNDPSIVYTRLEAVYVLSLKEFEPKEDDEDVDAGDEGIGF